MVRLRTVRLGGPVVRSVRRNAADGGEVDDVSLYRDSSSAPVLDLQRKLKAIWDLLDAIIRCGVSLTRAVELSHLWDCVVRMGSLPISRLVVLVFLRTLLALIKNSARLGFPTFAALGKGRPALMNSIVKVMGGCHVWESFPCRP